MSSEDEQLIQESLQRIKKERKTFLHPTFFLAIFLIIIYIILAIIGGSFLTIDPGLVQIVGLWNYAVTHWGWVWQFFTAMFVHSSLIHILINLVFLTIYGLVAEKFVKIQGLLLTFFVSGLIGNMGSWLVFGVHTHTISSGASGAIYGLLGLNLVILYSVSKKAWIPLLIIIAIFTVAIVLSEPGINHVAHTFGIIGGLTLGYLMNKNRFFSQYKQKGFVLEEKKDSESYSNFEEE
ncbi:MAG: rhomboid family intramembrane serine protease [Candidatus Heimdallarchaeota archaeon]|nr:rhomboid family intramembrane serine protease [Candidatus Heimdallarchaeota archaeon]